VRKKNIFILPKNKIKIILFYLKKKILKKIKIILFYFKKKFASLIMTNLQ